MANDTLRAAVLLTLGMLLFAVEDALIKLLASAMPFAEVLGMIGLAGLLVFWALLRREGGRFWTRDLLHPAVMLRNGTEGIGAVCIVLALGLTDLSATAAIMQAVPLFIALGAALWLDEPVGWRRGSAIVIGFLGVLLVLRPGVAGFQPASLWAVIAAISLAARDLATRRIPRRMHSLHLSASAFLAVVFGAGLMGLVVGDPLTLPDGRQAALGLLCVVISICGYSLLVTATRLAEASALAPVRYARLVFALILSVIVFGERLDAATIAGAAIIVGSGSYTFWRDATLARRARLAAGRPAGAEAGLAGSSTPAP